MVPSTAEADYDHHGESTVVSDIAVTDDANEEGMAKTKEQPKPHRLPNTTQM